jgi:hypothetical protein
MTLFTGVIGLLATQFLKLTPISLYKTPIQLVSIGLIVFGIFMSGAIYNNQTWVDKVQELEAKIKIAEEKSKQVNTDLNEKIVEKKIIIKEKGQDIIQYIDRDVIKKEEIIKYIEMCPVPKEIVELHNKAARLDK